MMQYKNEDDWNKNFKQKYMKKTEIYHRASTEASHDARNQIEHLIPSQHDFLELDDYEILTKFLKCLSAINITHKAHGYPSIPTHPHNNHKYYEDWQSSSKRDAHMYYREVRSSLYDKYKICLGNDNHKFSSKSNYKKHRLLITEIMNKMREIDNRL